MVFVIAEIGVNHNGDLNTAHSLIKVAAAAGANAAKFQLFTPFRLDPPGARREVLSHLKIIPFHVIGLAEFCAGEGIEFMATPFDVKWLKMLVSLKVRHIKLSSSSIDDMELLEAAGKTGIPVILSTGLADGVQIARALDVLSGADVTLMHCVSEYPTPIENVNLRRLLDLRDLHPKVGLSDHSTSIYPAIAAVGMGAVVIEKHLTLDKGAEGPDHRSSIEKDDFDEMVYAIREVESAYGEGGLSPRASQEVVNIKKERDEWRALLSKNGESADVYLKS